MRHLNEVQDARATTLIQEGWTFRRVAVDLNVSPSVIQSLWNGYDETGQLKRRVKQGRERITTPHDDQYMTICALRRRSETARELQQELRMVTGVTVSDQTLRNKLTKMPLKRRNIVELVFCLPVTTSTGNIANGDLCCSQTSPDFPWHSMMDVNMYGDAVVSSTCQMLSRKATVTDKIL
jgi:Transposase and inactivated derivatives